MNNHQKYGLTCFLLFIHSNYPFFTHISTPNKVYSHPPFFRKIPLLPKNSKIFQTETDSRLSATGCFVGQPQPVWYLGLYSLTEYRICNNLTRCPRRLWYWPLDTLGQACVWYSFEIFGTHGQWMKTAWECLFIGPIVAFRAGIEAHCHAHSLFCGCFTLSGPLHG